MAAVLVNDPGCLKCVTQVGVDDRPGLRIGVIDRDLICGQTVLKDFVFDPGERQRPRGVEPKRL